MHFEMWQILNVGFPDLAGKHARKNARATDTYAMARKHVTHDKYVVPTHHKWPHPYPEPGQNSGGYGYAPELVLLVQR